MTDAKVPTHIFPKAEEGAVAAKLVTPTPQTQSDSYILAYQDDAFLLRDELRPVRFQLELMKPELFFEEAKIGSTFVFYGSARIPERGHKAHGATPEICASLEAKSHYYEVARELARLAGCSNVDEDGRKHFVVCSGGGPSIMEAANRGAADAGCESIGLNIVLPHEQAPNRYVTPELSFQFHYFALRKMHFLLRARAVAVFPGGFGTFDEMFELLTLMQTGKTRRMPVLLYGKDFWNRVVSFEALVEEGVISPGDIELLTFVETAEEGWDAVKRFYETPAPATA